MRCIPDHAECAEVLIGHMRILARPIMAFVRLSQGQSIGKMNNKKGKKSMKIFPRWNV